MKLMKVESYDVEAGTGKPSPLWGGDANYWCSGQGKCAVGMGGALASYPV
jgi:hypothetical protein